MAISLKQSKPNLYLVQEGEAILGSIKTYDNSFHASHSYLELDLAIEEFPIDANPFCLLRNRVKKPLQVMLPSTEKKRIALLERCGFRCKRHTFELEVTEKDLKTNLPAQTIALATTTQGQAIYHACCTLLYQTYCQSHHSINPLTASFETFMAKLPTEVCYQELTGQVLHAVFLDGSELAYFCSADPASYPAFLDAVLKQAFKLHTTISFEADDGDWAAMTACNRFPLPAESYNTYILD